MSEGNDKRDQAVRLNYVIPDELASLLNRHCAQTLTQPSKLVRSLIASFVEGSIDLPEKPELHPRGLRTTVMLPSRLLAAFSTKISEKNYGTKSSAITGLLTNYLPPRTEDRESVRVEASIPTNIFSRLHERFGPGPVEDLVLRAIVSATQWCTAEEEAR